MRKLPTRLISIASLACASATEPAPPNGAWTTLDTWAGQVVITPDPDHPRWPRDAVTIRSAAIEGDSLELSVSFGGGCRQHGFLLLANAAFAESYPVQAGVKLAHEANDDMCDALLSRTLRFDLTPLKTAYDNAYHTTTGFIRIHVTAGHSVTYSW